MKRGSGSRSCVRLFATPWAVAHQAPLSMEFSRQELWSGLPFPSPGRLSNPGIKPRSLTLQEDSLLSEPPGKPRTVYRSQYKFAVYSRYSKKPSKHFKYVCGGWWHGLIYVSKDHSELNSPIPS